MCDLWSRVAIGFSSLRGESVFYSRAFISDTAAIKKTPTHLEMTHFISSNHKLYITTPADR